MYIQYLKIHSLSNVQTQINSKPIQISKDLNLILSKLYLLEMSKLNVKRITSIKKRNKVKPFETFSDGYELGNTLTKKWNSQPNPPKIYIDGYRIHHGLVGTLLGLAGLITEKPAITGLGVKLALDDIDDVPDWLNFERNNSIQYNDTSIPLSYNGFA